MKSGSGAIRDCGPGGDVHHFVGKHTFVHVLEAEEDGPTMKSSSSEPSLSSQSADSSRSHDGLFRQRLQQVEDDRAAGIDPGGGFSAFANSGAGRESRLARGGSSRGGGSGSIRDCGPGGSGGTAGSSDGHAFVVKHTFVHVVEDDAQPTLRSSSSEPSLSSNSASSSFSQEVRERYMKSSAADVEAGGGSTSSDIGTPGKGGRGRGRSRGAGSSGDGGGKGGSRGGGATSSSHGRGRGRSRGQQDSGGSADAAGFHKADASGSEGPGHAEGTCVPCIFVTRGEACPDRPTCIGCHHAQHLAKYRSRRPCKNKREKYMKALQEGLDQVNQNPNLEIDEVLLPASVKDNSIYQAKFLERMRTHKDWLASGGGMQSGESPAAVVRGPRVAPEAVPSGEAPPVRIIMSL